MEDQKLRFVIVGTGNISNTYVNALKNLENADLCGIISRTGRRPSELPPEFIVEVADQLSSIKSGYDAVILCTPNGLHHKGAIEAAKLGKHVLVEKPLDISIAAMDEMTAACREAGVKLGVTYQRRLSGDNSLVKRLLTEQAFGKVFAADLAVKNYRDDNYYNSAAYRGTKDIDGGGPFMQQASHYVDLYGWLFGKPQKITSYLRTFVHDIEVEDHGVAICQHQNGMVGTIIASTAAKPGFPAKLEIHSEKGTVILENDLITFWSIEGTENPTRYSVEQKHTGATTAVVNDTTNHEAIIKDFITAVQENREPFINGDEGRIATEMILEIYNQ